MNVYQIKISLIGSIPTIYRRVLVPSDILLPMLHTVIQAAMGWTNSHLHQFVKGREFYGEPSDDPDFDINDYTEIPLSSFLKKAKDTFKYEYDFGDGWAHDIVLEKILPLTDDFKHPVCIEGKMSCPPEDCGGLRGYYGMLDILKQPNHEEYEEYIEWLGGDFNPEEFSVNYVNIELSFLN